MEDSRTGECGPLHGDAGQQARSQGSQRQDDKVLTTLRELLVLKPEVGQVLEGLDKDLLVAINNKASLPKEKDTQQKNQALAGLLQQQNHLLKKLQHTVERVSKV